MTSGESVLIPYEGSELNPGQRYYWQVKVWDNKGRDIKVERNSILGNRIAYHLRTGKQNGLKWSGDTNRYSPSPHFRKEFTVSKTVASAEFMLHPMDFMSFI